MACTPSTLPFSMVLSCSLKTPVCIFKTYVLSDTTFLTQKFTLRRQNQIVRGGESWSFSYWFMPDPLLEPKDYFFLGVVEYKDEVIMTLHDFLHVTG